jgi:hypothetical protein
MIVAGPHDSSRAFPFDLSLWRSDHTPPIAKAVSDSLRDGFVLGGYTQKISIHSVGALAVRFPVDCG